MDGEVDIQDYIRSLEEVYQPAALQAAVDGMYRFASFVMGQAQELCPKKTGTLAASGNVQEPVVEGVDASIELGFNTNYAAAVHEILTNHHPNGQAKFLETPLMQNAPRFNAYIIAAIDKAVK